MVNHQPAEAEPRDEALAPVEGVGALAVPDDDGVRPGAPARLEGRVVGGRPFAAARVDAPQRVGY
jgi:hypothetical protein